MFENFKTDEETVVTPAESSTAPVTEPKETPQPAEALKTEEPEAGKAVPYDRFKEVNQKYRDTEAKLKEYQEKAEKFKAYEALDERMVADPVLNREINSIIERYNKGELTKAEMKEEIAEAKSEAVSVDPVSSKIEQIERTLQEQNVTRYYEHFNNRVSKDYTDKEDIRILEDYTTKLLLQKYPNAPKKYDQKILDEAYDQARDVFEGFAKRRTAGYVKEKTSDAVPATKTGASVISTKEFMDRSEASAAIAAGLKAARQKQ